MTSIKPVWFIGATPDVERFHRVCVMLRLGVMTDEDRRWIANAVNFRATFGEPLHETWFYKAWVG
jgi:hypothetical protein